MPVNAVSVFVAFLFPCQLTLSVFSLVFLFTSQLVNAVSVFDGFFLPLPLNTVSVFVGHFIPLPANAVSVLVARLPCYDCHTGLGFKNQLLLHTIASVH